MDEAQRLDPNRCRDRGRDVAPSEESHASLVTVSRWDGVDNRPAAERRLATQDHAVAASGDDGCCETELGELLAESNDARCRVPRPDVHLHARAVLDRRDLLERDVEPVGGRVPVARDERFPSRDLAALDAGEAHRDPLPRICTLDVTVVHLDAPHPHVVPARLEPKQISGTDRARPQRARHDRAESRDGEGAIDVEPRREVGARLLDGLRGALERCAKLVEPLTRLRTDAHDVDVGDELACLLFGELRRRPRRPRRSS